MISFEEKADVSDWRAVLEALPSSMQEQAELGVFWLLFISRDWTKARELIRNSSSEELPYGPVLVPRMCFEIPIAKYKGEHPEDNPELGAARDELLRKVKEHPEEWFLLSFLGQVDAYLGRKHEAIEEAKRAVGMWPDATDGPVLMSTLAAVYAITNEADLAFQILDVSIKTPKGVTYGDLKLNPDWDPLRALTNC